MVAANAAKRSRVLLRIRWGRLREAEQNGAYWATPVGWFACALGLVDPGLASRTILDLVADCRERGVSEWVLGERTVRQDYVASATLPLAGARVLLERHAK